MTDELVRKTSSDTVDLVSESDSEIDDQDSDAPRSTNHCRHSQHDHVEDGDLDRQDGDGDGRGDKAHDLSETSKVCKNFCCKADRVEPNQPTSSSVLSRTRHRVGQQSRSVSARWSIDYSWLSLCESRNALLCFYCATARQKQLLSFSKKIDDAFLRLDLKLEESDNAV